MAVLFQGLLLGLIVLFLVRLYVTHEPFALRVNWWFDSIQKWYERLRHLKADERREFLSVVMVVLVAVVFTLLIGGFDLLAGLLFLSLLLVPAIPASMEAARRSQMSELERVAEQIGKGSVSKKEIDLIKDALRDYYERQYAPRKRGEMPSLLVKIVVWAIALAQPKSWPRLLIPKITAIPWFAPLFLDSPFHAEYRPQRKFYESMYYQLYSHHYHLKVEQILFDEEFVMITFRGTKDHPLERARALARQLEQEYGWDEETILVNEEEAGVKLFLANGVLAE